MYESINYCRKHAAPWYPSGQNVMGSQDPSLATFGSCLFFLFFFFGWGGGGVEGVGGAYGSL